MASSQQSTFGEVYVNRHNGDRQCDKCVSIDGDGKPVRCTNTAKIVLHRKYTGVSEFYCGIHTLNTWEDMVEK